MEGNRNYTERCKEIQKELEKMPVEAYILFFKNALPRFKKYHPADWALIKESMEAEYAPDIEGKLPWPYSCFKAMHETAKNAWKDTGH